MTGVIYPNKFLAQILLPCQFQIDHKRFHRHSALASLVPVRAIIIVMIQPFVKVLIQLLHVGIDLFSVASTRANVAKRALVGLSLHSPLLLVPESNLAYLEAATTKTKNIITWKDAYPYNRAQYSPLIGGLAKGMAKLFAIVPCSVAGIVQPSISMTAYLIDSVSGARMPLAFSIMNKTHKENLEILFLELPLSNVALGKYLLYFHAENASTKTVSYSQTTLIINP
jgi:hypothetical protein